LQKLDVDRIGFKAKFYPSALHECAVGTTSYATLIVYNDETFASNRPTKLADFFDVQRYPGKRGLLKGPFGNLEWALIADGVPAAQVYSELATSHGVDRAFKKLDTIKSEIVWWDYGKGSSQPFQLLSDSRVMMTSAWTGGIKNPINSGAFAIIWDYQEIDWNYWAIPKGAQSDLAYDFLKFASSPGPMAQMAEAVRYGPSNVDAVTMITTATLDDLPSDPAHMATAFPVDPEFWASHHDELSTRFSAWLAQ
jgi:putative spermidine/putrescine transport system substrate-binding protein